MPEEKFCFTHPHDGAVSEGVKMHKAEQVSIDTEGKYWPGNNHGMTGSSDSTKTESLLGVCAFALLLSACSGGGGGSGPSSPGGTPQARPIAEPVNPDRVVVDVEGQRERWVDVAVVDTGIDSAHRDFSGDALGESIRLQSLKCDLFNLSNGRAPAETADHDGHGTAVASVVGGSYAGYANNARLMSVDVVESDTDQAMTSDLFLAAGESAARGAEVINMSWSLDPVGDAGAFRSRSNSLIGDSIEKVIDHGAVIVSAAGNDAKSYSREENAEYTWSADDPLVASTLVVGALDRDGELADYSRYAGDNALVRSRFIVAPGKNRAAVANGDGEGFQDFTGTSSAAPVVSAGMASVLGRWGHLSAVEAAQILLDAADQSFTDQYKRTGCGERGQVNCGAYTYGQGKLDVAAAMAPVGELEVPLGDHVDARSAAASETALHLGGASSGVSHALGDVLKSVSVLDRYGRDYSADLSGQVAAADEGPGLGARVARRIDRAGASGRAALYADSGLYQSFGFAPGGGVEHMRFGYRSESLDLMAYHDSIALGSAHLGGVQMLSYANDPVLSALDAHSGVSMRAELTDALSLNLGGTQGTRLGYGKASLSGGEIGFTQALSPRWSMSAGFARFDERNGALGMTGIGALSSEGGGVMSLPSLGVHYERDDLRAFVRYQRGEASARFTGSLIESVDATLERAAMGGSFAFGERGDQRVAIVASTPLHISDGTASVRVPTGRDDAGRVVLENRRAELAAPSIPMDLELGYQRAFSEHRRLSFNALTGRRAGGDRHALTLTFNQDF